MRGAFFLEFAEVAYFSSNRKDYSSYRLSKIYAIREAGELRFLPIVLTTFTATSGITPIAVSTNPEI